jgi:hypothetical protein
VPHLLGYGFAPWVALGAYRVVTNGPRQLPPLVLAAACGSLTPGGGLLCTGAALAGVLAGPARRRPGTALAAVGGVALLQSPWIVAGALHPATAAAAAAGAPGAEVFAVRAESPAGVVVDTLGLGGLWAGGALPGSRTGLWPLAATVLLPARRRGPRAGGSPRPPRPWPPPATRSHSCRTCPGAPACCGSSSRTSRAGGCCVTATGGWRGRRSSSRCWPGTAPPGSPAPRPGAYRG